MVLVAAVACGDKDPTGSVDTAASDTGDGDGIDPAEDTSTPPLLEDTGGTDSGGASADVDADADGFTPAEGDCDDTDPAVNPGAVEVDWDGVDNDCDGSRGHAAVSLALGRHHSCALDASGSAHCWGSDLDGQATPVGGSFVLLVANDTGTCGLDAAGQVTCWGRPFNEPLIDLNTRVHWQTGDTGAVQTLFWLGSELCGTDLDDTLHCIGPLEAATGVMTSGSSVIDGHGTSGSWMVIDGDGNMGGMHASGSYRLSCEGQPDAREPMAFARWSGIAAIDGGFEHQCTLGTDGTLDCWGCMGGQVVTPPMGSFATYASGDEHACAVDAVGAVTCWGEDALGQASPPAASRFSAIEAGGFHTCGIRTDGEVECWGSDSAGQTAVP